MDGIKTDAGYPRPSPKLRLYIYGGLAVPDIEHERFDTRTLGYRCQSMKLADVESWADELQAKYRAYVERLGITVPAT